MEEYERAIKAVMKARRNCKNAGIAAVSLDEKIGFERLGRELEGVIRVLRINYYEYENALSLSRSAARCSECGEVQPSIGGKA